MKRKVVIIGAGIGGLSCAAYLAKAGFDVTILEKNSWAGGRINSWKSNGFTFDLGPSWYWMPEVFEQFYKDFGYKTSDFYNLHRLDPSYRIFFEDEYIDLPADKNQMCDLFEKYEKGAGRKLNRLLRQTETVYIQTMNTFIQKSFSSIVDILDFKILTSGIKILAQYNGFQSVDQFIRKQFKNEKLIKILEFPIFFLGGSSSQIPAIYSIMNHVDINLGSWYPIGGFGEVAKAFNSVAQKLGVKIFLNQEVKKINEHSVVTNNKTYSADIIVSNADYHHTETELINFGSQTYSDSYWESKKIAPSALLIYAGLNKKLPQLLHHTLFFHNNWKEHNRSLYEHPNWPEKPLYYVSCSSKTDPNVAPVNCDALVILMPIAAGLTDNDSIRQHYFNFIIKDLEKKIGEKILNSIAVKKIYSTTDFCTDFHAYKGNAYGLAHTMEQTAFFRPRNRSKKLSNLFYTGQFTNPGIGVPMVIISGKIVAKQITDIYGNKGN